MALRTANKRAKLTAEGGERNKYGIHTVLISSHGSACPLCQQWQGRVYIDDVYSNGISDGKYPLLSTAIASGMFHPNCQNGLSTYIEGINSIPSPPTESEKQEQIKNYDLQQKQRYNERQIRRYKRLSEYSLDDANKQKYSGLLRHWQARQREFISNNSDVLRRQYDREKIYTSNSLTSGSNSGNIKSNKYFHSIDDPLREILGSAYQSHPEKVAELLEYLKSVNVEVMIRDENESLGYQPAVSSGNPGQIVLNKKASISAWLHEVQHVKDDEASGWCGMRILFTDPEERYQWEIRAYN
jgi:hypothetical protein